MEIKNLTDFLSVYGAIVATIVFLWDIVKWLQEKPKFHIKIKPHTCYTDTIDLVSATKNVHGALDLPLYYHIEITNRGKVAGTIISICAKSGNNSINAISFIAHLGQNLPHPLAPGDLWSCRIAESSVEAIKLNSKVRLEIDVSYQDKTIFAEFPN